MKTFFKDSWWILKTWGLFAGIQYVWNSFLRLFNKGPHSKRFEDLSDDEAEKIAFAFGLYSWTDRQDLNEKWNAYESLKSSDDFSDDSLHTYH